MAKYTVMIGRPCMGSHRQEVANFCIEAQIAAMKDPRLGDCMHVPIGQVPAPVARNRLVALAQRQGVDLLFMIDDDMGVPPGFFQAAVAFLLAHTGPAAIGVPYVMGAPREDVNVFEWGSGQSHTKDKVWGLEKIVREDAVRRSGIEEVANIGTGCIAYKVEAFARLKHPYYDYDYADETHTEVIETEDTYCHRHMHFAGVPIFCAWDFWALHYKVKACGKPEIIDKRRLQDAFLDHARAEVKHELKAEAAARRSADPLPQNGKVPACP